MGIRLAIAAGVLACSLSALGAEPSPFADALAVWHMGGREDSAGKNSSLTVHGAVELGVELQGDDRAASLQRGGDGRVARFEDGWLTAGQGADGELNLSGKAASLCLRLRDPAGTWGAGLFSKMGQPRNYNFYARNNISGMELCFEVDLQDEKAWRLLAAPLEILNPRDWHDVIVRYDGSQLQLFVDGILRDKKPATGRLAEVPRGGCTLGANPGGVRRFHGLIDHAAVWNRALTDAEIEFLSGGSAAIERHRQAELEARRQRDQQAQKRQQEGLPGILRDPDYPQYHVAPPGGWMNDPHPVFFKGAYHLFYQYSVGPGVYGGRNRWGHAVSRDLVHWEHRPPGVTPEEHGRGAHIWSGCVIDHDGVGTAVYTIENIDVWTATAEDDGLVRFRKSPHNPVIQGPPPGVKIAGGMRDPWVWKEKDGWYLIVGSGFHGGKGLFLPLYRSTDLIHWQYLHPLYHGDPATEGTFCECPSFFDLGDKHVLVYSGAYRVGRYENHRLIAQQGGRLDYGCVLVPQLARDGKGRWILWGWIVDARNSEFQRVAGWTGVQTLPRVVSLGPDGVLRYDVAEELAALRSAHRHFGRITLSPGVAHRPEGVEGRQLEIAAVFDVGNAQQVGFVLPDRDGQQMEILYDRKAAGLLAKNRSGPLVLAPGEPLELRLFIDGSVVEVIANRRLCLTQRIYPSGSEALRPAILARGGTATVRTLDVWKMGSIWSKDLAAGASPFAE